MEGTPSLCDVGRRRRTGPRGAPKREHAALCRVVERAHSVLELRAPRLGLQRPPQRHQVLGGAVGTVVRGAQTEP